LNPSEIIWRTKDHSLPQEMLDQGMITEDQMGLHPEQNQLTRSINIRKKHRVEVKRLSPMAPQESFVLCSDGFWEFVSRDELLQLADSGSSQALLESIAHAVTARATKHADNLTVLLLRLKR
jgi:PPM family protein phosphatase